MKDVENVIIIGSGCAGLTAAIYCARGELCPLVVEGIQPGGQLTTTSEIENFPGFEQGINGYDLAERMRKQAARFGTKFLSENVKSVDFSSAIKEIRCEHTNIYSKAVIIATGATPRMMNVPGEQKFLGGGGVSTCATCDAPFFRGKTVVVIGGGDSACEEAIFLTNFCEKVFIIHRRNELRASKIMSERVLNNAKINILWDSVLLEIFGDKKVQGIKFQNVHSQVISEITCDGVFLAIGHIPNTAPFYSESLVDEKGYIKSKSGSLVETDISGIFTAGDCCDHLFRQAITAAGMGCMAALSVEKFLREGSI